ncbi:MAG: hypothetical protein IPK59_17015 [Rhodospirillaceae bacterium]|nr:hypothetical protein [Rhodospirillaceae bacterium]
MASVLLRFLRPFGGAVAAICLFGCQADPPPLTGNFFDDVIVAHETRLLASMPQYAQREGTRLVIRLGADDAVAPFQDMTACNGQEDCLLYRLYDLDKDNQTATVFAQFYEGHGAVLIDLASGATIDLDDPPHVSPSGKYWAVADSDSGYGLGLVLVIARKAAGFAIVAEDFAHAYCEFDHWDGDDAFTLYCPLAHVDEYEEIVVQRSKISAWSEKATGKTITSDQFNARVWRE